MRPWYKTLVLNVESQAPVTMDSTFEDHKRSMHGYVCDGYETRASFFQRHLDDSPRATAYQHFLERHLPPGARVLSVASGRAANEMRLLERGYDVTCSDLGPVCAEETRRLFPAYVFRRWNALADPVPDERFDGAMAMSFLYLLGPAELDEFFRRMHQILRPGGVLVLDPGGSADGGLANLWCDVCLPLEARIVGPLQNLYRRLRGRPGVRVHTRHFGYRTRHEDVVAAASRAGLSLKGFESGDVETELSRSVIYTHVLRRVPLARRLCLAWGWRMPYLRLFAFVKAVRASVIAALSALPGASVAIAEELSAWAAIACA
jgi:SAM-dependent methyltransferase